MKIKRSCPSNKSWVEKKGVKNGGFCRVLPGKKRSISAPMGKAAPKMRQTALNLPSEPSTDYRGELLSVGITSAVLGALGGSVAAAMLLTPKGSGEAFRSGQQEAALNFEKEKAELESKYAGEIEKLKKTAGVNPKAQAEIDRLTKENESLKNQTPVLDPEMKNENDRLTQELAEKETIAKQSEEKLAALTQEHEELKRSSEKANADLEEVTKKFTKLQESSKTASKPDPKLQSQLDKLSRQVSSLSATAEERRVALVNKEAEHTQLQDQHKAIVAEINKHKTIVATQQGDIDAHLGTIAERNQTIDERNQTIAGLETTIAALREHISDLDSQLGNANLTNATLSSEAKDVGGQRAEAASALAQARAMLTKSEQEKQDLVRQIESYRKQQDEIEKTLKIEENERGSETIKSRIIEMEKALSKAQSDLNEGIFASETHGISTHLTGIGVRERYGGIQLRESVAQKKVEISTMTAPKLNAAVRNATRNLFVPLESKVFYPSSEEDNTSFLSEWESRHNDVLKKFKEGALTEDEFWRQIATAHYQHTQRRQHFTSKITSIRSSHSDTAASTAINFLSKYNAADSEEKRANILTEYDRAFKRQYQEIKKDISDLQEEARSLYPLDFFLGETGEEDTEKRESFFRTEYLAALLGNGKKKEVRGLNDRIRDMMGSNRSETEQGMTTTTTQEEVRGLSFDTVRFDDPEANKKAAEILEALEKAIDKKYGKLSYRNPDHREALNRRREEIDDLNNRYSSWLKDYARATSKVWNPGNPTEAEEKRMRQQMDLFKSQQMYESQLLRGEYKPDRKKKNRKK